MDKSSAPNEPEKVKPFAGTISGVWVDSSSGNPRVVLESTDGRTYMMKCKEVWPGKQEGEKK